MCWRCAEVTNPVPAGQGSASRFGPYRPPRSLHAQVPGGGHLTRAASDRRHGQAAEEQVHGWEEGLEQADGAEGRASVRSEVDLVGVGAGRLQQSLVLAARPGWEDGRRSLKRWIFRVGDNSQLCNRVISRCHTLQSGEKKKHFTAGSRCTISCRLTP